MKLFCDHKKSVYIFFVHFDVPVLYHMTEIIRFNFSNSVNFNISVELALKINKNIVEQYG